MKIPKVLYFNIILLVLILFMSFGVGSFIISNFMTLPAIAVDEDEDAVPPSITNVEVSRVSATSSTIIWETNELSDSLINYGLDDNYGTAREPRFDKLSHEILLDNLLSGTKYYFRITSSDESGNQGISSNFSFTTEVDELEIEEEGKNEEILKEGDGGLSEELLLDGAGGLSEQGVRELLRAIREITTEEVVEEIQEELTSKAEEIVAPPTIILDYADVEVGEDYANISWKTDKESNSVVALVTESDYDAESVDPYTWKEGEPDELVLDHMVYVNGLRPATTYHFQVSSEDDLGLTGRSSDKSFRTKSVQPEIYNLSIAKIEEESATLRWTTNVPCSSLVEYANLNTGETKLEGNSSFLTVHKIQLKNLIFDTYYSAVVTVKSEDDEETTSIPLTFITTRDKYPPVISKVNTESTIYPGSDNKIQTIASWETDEPSKCQLFYHQGLFAKDNTNSLNKEDDFMTKHVQVITNFLPSSVYKFWLICYDEAENEAKSEDFSMLTPSREESIIDIIIKNFESSFGWVKKMKI